MLTARVTQMAALKYQTIGFILIWRQKDKATVTAMGTGLMGPKPPDEEPRTEMGAATACASGLAHQ